MDQGALGRAGLCRGIRAILQITLTCQHPGLVHLLREHIDRNFDDFGGGLVE